MVGKRVAVLLLLFSTLTCDPKPLRQAGEPEGPGQPYGWPGPWPLAQIYWSHVGGFVVHAGYGYWELHTFWSEAGWGPQRGKLAIFRAPLGVGNSNGDAEIRAARAMVWREVCAHIGQEDVWVDRDNQYELKWYTAKWMRDLLPYVQCGPFERIL